MPSRDYRKSQAQIDAERKQVLAERVFHHRLALYNTFATGNSLPYVVVTFPPDKDERNRNEDEVLWEGEADAQTIASLVDSPARAEIGRRILAGDSAVWAVILCGDAEKDEACLDQLDKILQKAEEVVELSLPGSEAKISVKPIHIIPELESV